MKTVVLIIALFLLPACGQDGRDGAPGRDGRNGVDGTDGNNGTLIELVDPCGDGPGHDEVVMIFDNGTVLAWYKDLGFARLSEGVAYHTTDRQRCLFMITDGTVEEL